MGFEDFLAQRCAQTAVYWESEGDDGYGNISYTSDSPMEIDCRWEDSTRVVVDAYGEEIIARAEIYVLQDLKEGGVLYLGNLDDLDSTEISDPRKLNSAYEIRRFDKIPMLGSTTKFLRKAYLTVWQR